MQEGQAEQATKSSEELWGELGSSGSGSGAVVT